MIFCSSAENQATPGIIHIQGDFPRCTGFIFNGKRFIEWIGIAFCEMGIGFGRIAERFFFYPGSEAGTANYGPSNVVVFVDLGHISGGVYDSINARKCR